MGFDRTKTRHGLITETLVVHAGPGVAAAVARDILDVLPDLYLLDEACRQLARTDTVAAALAAELKRDTSCEDLPEPGTTMADALVAEADRLRRAGVPAGAFAAGFRAGRDVFLRGLRSRAAYLRNNSADPRRPGGEPDPLHPVAPAMTASPARAALAQRVAQLPADRAERFAHHRHWVESRLRKSGVDADHHALAELVLRRLPELNDLPRVLAELTESEARVHQLRRELAAHRAERGLTDADVRWRSTLAAELRQHADGVPGSASDADPFSIGFTEAVLRLAEQLRARADEISVARIG